MRRAFLLLALLTSCSDPIDVGPIDLCGLDDRAPCTSCEDATEGARCVADGGEGQCVDGVCQATGT
jgi:hypothetical protein